MTPRPTLIDSADLAREAARGDELAFRTLIEAHHRAIAALCFAITRDTELAADAAQATWIQAWRGMRSLRRPERVEPWLCTIAANESRALLRRRRRSPVVPLDVIDPDGFARDDLASRATDLDLMKAMARLDPDDRALLALRYVAGLTSTELAAAAGLSPSGMRARLGRLLGRLRQELGDG